MIKKLKKKWVHSSHTLSGLVITVVSPDARLYSFDSLSQARSHIMYSVFALSLLTVEACEPHLSGVELRM